MSEHGIGTPDLLNDCFRFYVFGSANDDDEEQNSTESMPIPYMMDSNTTDCLANYYTNHTGWFVLGELNITNVTVTSNTVKFEARPFYKTEGDERRLASSCSWHLGATCSGATGTLSFDTRTCTASGCSGWSINSGRDITVPRYSSGLISSTCGRSLVALCRRLDTYLSGASSDYVGTTKCTVGRFTQEWKLTCN